MKNDPFASLSGLDQQLFQEEKQGNKETRKLGNKQTSGPAVPQVSNPESKQAEQGTSGPAATQASNQDSNPAEHQGTNPAGNEASRTPVSQSSGHPKPVVRPEGRHTYDIFQDQVRWMNRAKLDIEDTYGEKITINGIVKLGLDLLREDYDVNGEDSNLMRVLAFGKLIRLQGPLKKAKEVAD